MKRDLDLMRQILFYVEENGDIRKGYIKDVFITDSYGKKIDKFIIREHILLLEDAGLLRKHNRIKVALFGAGNLTNDGYDYIELFRSNETWKKTKKKAADNNIPQTLETYGNIAASMAGAFMREFSRN